MTDLNDLLVTSPDLNSERLETLKRLFPDLFTDEGKLNQAELKSLFENEVTTDREHYTFTWRGKGKAKQHAFTPSRAALTYDPKRSVSPEKANGNMIIEGENLEVLKLLTLAYREQVKCIYIDPPYNKDADVVYRDNYARDRKEYWEQNGAYQDGVKVDTNPETSGRYHSDWLSMMYSRLLIARQLLCEDGVIFVSIDDHESHNLRKVMDEVFGEENFIADVVVVNNLKGRSDKRYIATAHERLLMYVKSEEFQESGLDMPEDRIEEYSYEDEIGKYRLLGLRKRGGADTRAKRPNMFFPIYADPEDGTVSLAKDEQHTVEILPIKSDGTEGAWRWGFNTVERGLEWLVAQPLTTNESEFRVYEKDYLETDGEIRRIKPKSVMYGANYSTDGATKAFRKLFPESGFKNPKPVPFLMDLFSYSTAKTKGDIVLDFFAGSGTTGQAVMELNEEDGGNRQVILVQLPESLDKDKDQESYKAGYRTISQITIERCKRVIRGYGDKPQPLDTGFKVYRLTKSHFPRAEFQPNPNKTDEENVELLKQYIDEKEASFQITFDQDDVFDEVLLKHGFKLNYKLTKQEGFGSNAVYLVEEGDRKAYICLDTTIASETIDFFKTHTDITFICLERALDTTKKWNLNHNLGERLKAL